jgi:hypothetical protein
MEWPPDRALAAAGAVAGHLGTVIPKTVLFMASGLLLILESGRRAASAAESGRNSPHP